MKKVIILLLISINWALADSSLNEIQNLILNQEAVIIDVREKEEVDQGMLKQAEWFPLSEIESNKEWPKSLVKKTWGKKVYLYCKSGRRAEAVKELLAEKAIFSTNLGGYDELKSRWK